MIWYIKTLDFTIFGGLIEVNNYLIWHSTAMEPFGNTFLLPPSFTELEKCAVPLMRVSPKIHVMWGFFVICISNEMLSLKTNLKKQMIKLS